MHLIILTSKVYAQELNIISFKHLENNTTARINKKIDVNGKNCAVVIIKHSFREFEVESGKGNEHLISKTGETWVWLSPDEYRLVIRKEGYLPLVFELKDKMQSLETYELVVTDDFGVIIVEAENAMIWLNGKQIAESKCLMKLKKGKYALKVTKENFYPEERQIIIEAGDTLRYNFFKMIPKTGSLIITSYPNKTAGADIFINNDLNKLKTHATIPLRIGNYTVRVEKKGYIPFVDNIVVKENENTRLDAQMIIDYSISVSKHKKRKYIWLASGLAATGVGVFAVLQSNSLYKEYQTAGSNASELRKQIETYDIVYPIAFGVAALFGVGFVIESIKQSKAKKQLSLYTKPSFHGGVLSLLYRF